MIFKQYGTSYQSVALNFDSKALNEIGFRRDRRDSITTDDFEATYAKVQVHELTAEAEGPVQDETEQELLNRLEEKIQALLDGLTEGQILVVENESGHDYPKTRQKTSNVVVQGENRLHFRYSLAPALRVALYEKRG